MRNAEQNRYTIITYHTLKYPERRKVRNDEKLRHNFICILTDLYQKWETNFWRFHRKWNWSTKIHPRKTGDYSWCSASKVLGSISHMVNTESESIFGIGKRPRFFAPDIIVLSLQDVTRIFLNLNADKIPHLKDNKLAVQRLWFSNCLE